jgi:hypothetical protein
MATLHVMDKLILCLLELSMFGIWVANILIHKKDFNQENFVTKIFKKILSVKKEKS